MHLVLADPGGARTAMTDGMTPSSVPVVLRVGWPLFRLVQRAMTVERAARSSIVAATDAGLVDGSWVRPNGRVGGLPAPLRDTELRQVRPCPGRAARRTLASGCRPTSGR